MGIVDYDLKEKKGAKESNTAMPSLRIDWIKINKISLPLRRTARVRTLFLMGEKKWVTEFIAN